MTFSVSDGISMATTVVQVQVLSDGGLGPQRDATASMMLEVGEKSSTVIRRSQLSYSVSDRLKKLSALSRPSVSKDEMRWTLEKSGNQRSKTEVKRRLMSCLLQ